MMSTASDFIGSPLSLWHNKIMWWIFFILNFSLTNVWAEPWPFGCQKLQVQEESCLAISPAHHRVSFQLLLFHNFSSHEITLMDDEHNTNYVLPASRWGALGLKSQKVKFCCLEKTPTSEQYVPCDESIELCQYTLISSPKELKPIHWFGAYAELNILSAILRQQQVDVILVVDSNENDVQPNVDDSNQALSS